MRNALEQTLEDMRAFRLRVVDVAWIGSRPFYDGRPAVVGQYTEDWDEFAAWALGEAPVALDGLVMVLRDGRYLEARGSDFGSGCDWYLCGTPTPPLERVGFPRRDGTK